MTKNASLPEKMAYRPDIDGLRAWAVLLVIAFHYFGDIVPGGFVGVDIFFVISGYLIGGIIIDSLQNGTFSFRHFYARRILRIFPALLAVLFCVIGAAWLFFLPGELKYAGKYMAGGAAFIDNFLLMQETGYFAPAAHTTLFLNLWSLGIEEQFYIFFPLVLWLCRRRFSLFFGIVLVLGCISFAYGWHMAFVWGKIAEIFLDVDFYSPLTRTWELMLGAAAQCAGRMGAPGHAQAGFAVPARRFWTPPAAGLLISFCGICFIVCGVCSARPGMPWPGAGALWPCFGTFFILYANPGNIISRHFLANRLCVFTGKISYPLYLWHWPLLAFANQLANSREEASLSLRCALLAAALVLSIGTWAFVERPIRFGHALGRATIPVLCLGMCCAFALGLACYETGGFPGRASIKNAQTFLGRFEPEFLPLGSNHLTAANLLASAKNIARKHAGVFPEPEEYLANQAGLLRAGIKAGDLQYCVFFDAHAPRTIAVVGDSHGSIAFPLSRLGMREGFNTLYLGRLQPGMEGTMAVQKERILSILASMPDVKKVLIVCRGVLYMTGIHNKGEMREKSFYIPNGEARYASELESFADALLKMGKQVAILAENPELDIDPKNLLSRIPFSFGIKHEPPPLTREETLARQKPYLGLLARMSRIPGVEVLNTIDTLCPKGMCKVINENGISLYFDDDHLSSAGNALVADKVVLPWILKKNNGNGE